jgi:putative FmdB family regulatory protein
MPIYEFSCAGCGKRVEIFRRTVSSTAPATCPGCGSADLRRLISRFAVHRSASVYGSAGEERYLDGLDEGDPRAMAAWARRMGQESGEEMGPEFDEMISKMEAREMPDDGPGDDGDLDDFDDLEP